MFVITAEGDIRIDDTETPSEAKADTLRFGDEQELQKIAKSWPVKRLVEIWNRLPGVQRVSKFENKAIGVARIWRALPAGGEGSEPPATKRNAPPPPLFHPESKAARVYALLARPEGARLSEIRAATGWERHTVRGFISRSVRKQGRKVPSFQKDGERVYRLKP